MKKEFERTNFQSEKEERINALTHIISAALALLGTALLVVKTAEMGPLAIVSASLYGAAMIILYTASSFYHLVSNGTRAKIFLQKFDHASIFLLITGTLYTGLLDFYGWNCWLACFFSGWILHNHWNYT